MHYADLSLQRFRGTGYEIDEMDVQILGDVGIVYYTATWRFVDADGVDRVLPLRSVDVHCLVLDGVYCTTGEVPVFHPVRAPTAEQLQTLLNPIITRVMKLLTHVKAIGLKSRA